MRDHNRWRTAHDSHRAGPPRDRGRPPALVITFLVLLAVALVAGCGDAGPTEAGAGADPDRAQFSIVQGDGQDQTVTDTLPVELVAEVRDTATGEPITGHLADWRVIDDGCGAPFVTTTETDAQGQTDNEWTLGQRAHTRIDPSRSDAPCRLELRLRVDGQSLTDTTFVAIARPGPVVGERLTGLQIQGSPPITVGMVKSRDNLESDMNARVHDQFGNPVNFRLAFDSLATVQDPDAWEGRRRVDLTGDVGCGPLRVLVSDSVVTRGVVEAEDQTGDGAADHLALNFTEDPYQDPGHSLAECVR